MSDLDIAIYFSIEPGLLDIGNIVNELETEINLTIDLISLNKLYLNNPELAYNIIKDGIVIHSKDNILLADYKKRVFIEYLDKKPMMDLFNQKFSERLRSGRFGETSL